MARIIPDTDSCGVWLKIRDLPRLYLDSREAAIQMIDFYWVYICPLPGVDNE